MMDVYADAVFFPRLSEDTFNQEGHRFELDEEGNVSVQGVVYNEMKGNYSNFGSVVFHCMSSALFPNTAYDKDSGGDPLEIMKLTDKEFTDFHKKYYSPQNCLLYLNGNIPTEKQLDFISENYIDRLQTKYNRTTELSDYKATLPPVYPEITTMEKIVPLEKSRVCRVKAPKAGMEGNTYCLTWYSGKPAMDKWFLSNILCGSGPASITKRLDESHLGDSNWSGQVNEYPEEFFVFG